MKTCIVGGGVGDKREARVLNRVVRWIMGGWQYEHDQRHSELIVKDLELEESMSLRPLRRQEKKRSDESWKLEQQS